MATGSDGDTILAIVRIEVFELRCSRPQALVAFVLFLRVLPLLDPPREPVSPLIEADAWRFAPADLDRPQGGIVEGLLRDNDQGGGVASCREWHLPLLPQFGQMEPPRFLQTSKEQIGPTEEENFRKRRVAFGERGQILVDHGLE